ncbi:MAG: endonuclease MutS2 [Oscillospiraceae bacterium]
MNQNDEILELHKILELLAGQCTNEASAQKALALTPSRDLYEVKREISKATAALELSVKYGRPAFLSFVNVQSLLKRADTGAVLTPAELIEIRRMLWQIGAAADWYAELKDEEKENALQAYFESLFPNRYLYAKLDKCLISADEIADDASAELYTIRRKLAQAGLRIRETLDSMIKSTSTQKYLQESIVTIRDGRFVIPVKAEFKGSVPGLVHDSSATGATLFVEPMSVVEANNDIRLLKGREQDEIRRILAELSSECAADMERICAGYDACVMLNLYFAKSELALKMNAAAPEISDDGVIVLKKARHPLIAKEKVVPVDFTLGAGYHALIITGPNTGGKTVVLKTVGLLTEMTMCGLLIPAAEESRISVFDNILVDIGDQQSIEQSLSTFSSHINRVNEIIRTADARSLVLLDELGSGTDPVEGAALAVAIIEQLLKQGAELVTTTHYQELKLFAIDTPDVENASCEFDVRTLMPTYRLIIGSPGKSNAFEISAKLGMDASIIDHAKSMLSADSKRFEKIIESLETARIELEEARRRIATHERTAKELTEQLQTERERISKEKEVEIDRARREAAAIVARVTRESEALMDELSAVLKQKDSAQFERLAQEQKHSYKGKLDKLYLEANPVTKRENTYQLPRALKKGDQVILSDTGKKAVVLTLPDNAGNCMVQAGIMKTKIAVEKLRLSQEDSKTTVGGKKLAVSTKGVESRMTRAAQMELDIRGYAVDDGLYELDSFLDNAVMAGMGTVMIIHGKGTGVLKNAVREHLRRHRHVKSSRKGIYGEGEDGVTVVELK